MTNELEVNPELAEIREGTTKLTLDEILGVKSENSETKDSETKDSEKESETKEKESETKEDKTKQEIFAEVKALTYGLNFIMVGLSGIVANLMGKQIDTKNISASDTELNRLAKVAQPVYLKYSSGMSDEKILALAILSVYGFRIAGEFMNASDLAKKTTKETQKPFDNMRESENESWKGNPDYFQTGKKAGTLKPSAK